MKLRLNKCLVKDDLSEEETQRKNQNRIMGEVYGGYGDEKRLIGKTV